MRKLGHLSFVLIAFACSTPEPKEYDPQVLVDQAIFAHGANLSGKKVSFDFRDRTYTLRRGKGSYTYIRAWQDDSLGFVQDILINSRDFTRFQDGDSVALDDELSIKKYVGEFEIKDETYLGVQVTFNEDGGGEDHEDVFLYWIHKEFSTIDYLAYSYLRGFLVQDYINFKAEKGTPLKDLPDLFNQGKLEELSRIENTKVKVY